MHIAALIILGLVLLKWAVQQALEILNQRNVLNHAGAVPETFAGYVDGETYRKSVDYTLAKSRFSQFELSWSTLILVLAVFSGVLPGWFNLFTQAAGQSAWAMGAFILITGLLLSVLGWPLDWYEQFHLEERFGFNTSTPRIWWMDRIKGILLSLLIGLPILALIFKLVEWTGAYWWLWAWAAVLVIQMVLLVLAPVLILPLFNKFSPLPEGSLRDRLMALAERTGFHARSIQVMDGSKRSKHSNAFFTGFGRFRKIVLFDTLLQHLDEREVEAVLAHEIGHYKKKHIPKMLAWSVLSSLIGFYLIAWLASQEWFYAAFGFEFGHIAPAFLLFGLLSGVATFWISPLANLWSRRFEYQADDFASRAMNEPAPLIQALRKLNEKNLSNLTPHPLYSGFYYSHPTLHEREQALMSEA
jgi:STE24 endopeptidase